MNYRRVLLCMSLIAAGATLVHAGEMSLPKPEVQLSGLDLSIDQIVLDPPSGTTLRAAEPITVSFRYRYSQPRIRMNVWAKVLDETYDSTYQGSIDPMAPGSGRIERQVFLNVPGRIETITLLGKDESSKETFRLSLPVDYTFVRNADVEARRSEGSGSTLALLGTSPSSPGTVRAGTPIEFKLAHDIRTLEGLWIWVEPVTSCDMSYEGTNYPDFGKGVVSKRIWIGQACELKQVKIGMVNRSRAKIVEKLVDVDFKIIK